MEDGKKEIGRFKLGISLLQEENGKITTIFFNRNFNVSKDVVLSQLRLFIKMVEDEVYPSFRDNITTIDLGPEE